MLVNKPICVGKYTFMTGGKSTLLMPIPISEMKKNPLNIRILELKLRLIRPMKIMTIANKRVFSKLILEDNLGAIQPNKENEIGGSIPRMDCEIVVMGKLSPIRLYIGESGVMAVRKFNVTRIMPIKASHLTVNCR